ncbi:TetR/AcrR family transcriptional regulator [Mycolicibacterium sp. YH-1]|jgi:AcrR family transcriptional regulator|uniref:TetR/AcrR family transcriptional regulator n=1 Tax=Mycolicibacterium sp. YH-1 TaxID=2908837 RepID=UPI001F4C3DF9|nr:TetR/AcrR family transcriptional regulator [Mycolicibacterium sp. YH-1]UNB55048.1 TetR/AcrR family transcriptional regulator [Mycolicibacterium sp. YH-1]
MMSISNDDMVEPVGDRILDAAASCVLSYGVDRVTLAEIARRAGVSRPTVYRRFPDTRSILAALLTLRITRALDDVPSRGVGRELLVERVVSVADLLRLDEVIMAVLHQAPDMAMVYLSERLGTSQQILLDTVAGEIKSAQDEGSVRPGDARELAAMSLLIAQSTILSADLIRPILDTEPLATELAHALNGYLKP